MKALIGAFASVAMVGAASAQVSGFSVDTTAGTTGNGDVVSNVLSIDFDGLYSGSQFLVRLDTGTVNQESFQNLGEDNFPEVAPSQGVLNAFGNIAFDSYFAQGGVSSAGTQGSLQIGGGAVNLDPAEVANVFDNELTSATKISQATNPSGTSNITDQTGFVVARLSFSADANGSFQYLGSAGPGGVTGDFFTTGPEYSIVNGGIVVPEPASLALLGLGGLAMLRRRSA